MYISEETCTDYFFLIISLCGDVTGTVLSKLITGFAPTFPNTQCQRIVWRNDLRCMYMWVVHACVCTLSTS